MSNIKIMKIMKIMKKLNRDEYSFLRNEFIEKVYSKSEIQILNNKYAESYFEIKLPKINDELPIESLYCEEIKRIEILINNVDLIKKINGLKIILHGETGTGKTSLVKRIKERNPNINFKNLSLEEIISSKMGQTQISLLSLAEKINSNSKNKKIILFIDEIDSIVGNRNLEDIGERKKIVSTFIKMLDKLDEKIVIIASTNYLKDIDNSIIRRFNFQIKGKKFYINSFIKYFEKISNYKLKRKKSFLNEILERKFSISDAYDFSNYLLIESKFNELNVFAEFIIFFNLYKKFQDKKLSKKVEKYIKKKVHNA